jgi:hypothetical protein
MTRLSERRTRLVFTTANEVKSRGKYRCVVIEARPDYALVRLQGMRTSFPIAYDAIYHAAAKIAAARERAEKLAARSKTRFS